MRLVETQDKSLVATQNTRRAQSQYKGGGLRPPVFVVCFVLSLSKAHVPGFNTAHALRISTADVLALS